MRTRTLLILLAAILVSVSSRATGQSGSKHLPSTAYAIPKHTAPEGEGYFAIIEGHNQRLYIGTHANAVNSWLVEFDPVKEKMDVVVDAHAAIGTDVTGFGAQSKIHTRNNVGKSGKIYFATKQGYPAKGELRLAYPGGYPMVYDPATQTTKVYPIPVPHQGIISITPDESHGLAYVSTCSDGRPIESSHFLALDLKTEKYTDFGDTEHLYAFIVVDHAGRAYHPLRGGGIARYNPDTKELDRLKQTIDGQAPPADSHLADEYSHPINWDISSDRKTLYAVPMSGNALYAYDLTSTGDTLPGRTIGPLVVDGQRVDCRALCVGPTGTVWCAVTEKRDKRHRQPYLIRYRPEKDDRPVNLGLITVSNPDFTEFHDQDGKQLRYHHGFGKLDDSKTVVPRHVLLGVCESKTGDVYVLAISPYTVLRVHRKTLHN